jgi:hypothetical protein
MHPGCTTLVKVGSRCSVHAKDNTQQRDPARQRLYDRRWRMIRAEHLSIHPWCENGLRQGIYVPATDVHHERQGLWLVRGIDSAQGVGCNNCGSLQEWHASEEAIVDLIRRLRGEEGVKKYRRYMHEYLS